MFRLAFAPVASSISCLQTQMRFKMKIGSRGGAVTPNKAPGPRLGIKAGNGALCREKDILVRQRKERWVAGKNTFYGKDWTIHASCAGVVSIERVQTEFGNRPLMTVIPNWREYREESSRRSRLGLLGLLPAEQRGNVTAADLKNPDSVPYTYADDDMA
eukprot:NODE_9330_length_649_cov_110.176806_g9064_i0.p1 GENE.NODE_9330_length_649_cov_110.176806_g9064_i0~~NODE_9330_length_649_cov_110.176806_g9064_i0.p1  ORF type:complete len:159 (+),score=20.30 NODE_9330_length_649_cov_110.176806_g9064_i0:92-568(+)